jgi:parallel beta-helix repeat protein
MKTLDQVEARTIVNATNTPGDAGNTFIISVPGSYYLTGNITPASIKNGISILADDVTLDLNGFAIIGGGIPRIGVFAPNAQTGICIRNGSVRGWAGAGVWTGYAVTVAENLRLIDNTSTPGLTVGNGSLVRDCVARGNGTGFGCADRTQISNCIATENTGIGFDCQGYVTIIDCTASRNFGAAGIKTLGSCSIIRCSATRNIPTGSGIIAGTGCTIADCTANNNQLDGINAEPGSSVRGCMAHANGDIGIRAASNCQVLGNTCDANKYGILVNGTGSRIDGNSVTSNTDLGLIDAGGSQNLIIRNSAHGNLMNFGGLAQDVVGAIVTSTPGTLSTSASPWSNFVY